MTRARLADVGLVTLAVLITIMNSGFSKPLWIDEYLHFAMGSLTFTEAIEVIAKTTGDGVNWGQTGTYLFLDYLLTSVFGANLWALRAPSIISGFVLLLAAVYFIRAVGLSRPWQLIALLILGSQWTLMYYVGEARPYLPMAASAVAVLAYYSVDVRRRSSWPARLLGIFGLLIGSAMHPYWLPFTVGLIAFSVWTAYRNSLVGTRSEFIKFLNVPLLTAGVAIYSGLALLTWLRGTTSFTTDPWMYVGSPIGGLRTLVSTHFDAISLQLIDLSAVDALLPGGVGIARFTSLTLLFGFGVVALTRTDLGRSLRPPVVLIMFGVTSSLGLAFVSYVNEYWVVQRQWLGGIAIASVGIAWALGVLWQYSGPRQIWPRLAVGALSTIVVAQFLSGIPERISRIADHSALYLNEFDSRGHPKSLVRKAIESSDLPFAGNVNIYRGGPVWREHGLYYGVECALGDPDTRTARALLDTVCRGACK